MHVEHSQEHVGPWQGFRWQESFTPPGAPFTPVVDATTSVEGRAWAVDIARRLREAGHLVAATEDEGEGADGAPVMYDQLAVRAGEGYVTMAFFADEVAWTVDIAPDECSRDIATRVVRDVAATVESVTGYVLRGSSLTPDELGLLGHA